MNREYDLLPRLFRALVDTRYRPMILIQSKTLRAIDKKDTFVRGIKMNSFPGPAEQEFGKAFNNKLPG